MEQVGESSKGAGSIGRKGIGFKSVFGLSDCPLLVSGGLAMRFDARSLGPYGYICPEVRGRQAGSKTGGGRV